MSNKAWDKLNALDRQLRSVIHTGPAAASVQVVIELRQGFEMFNTRPYHNYETWGAGYYVSGHGQHASAEDLDDAISLFVKRVQEERTRARGEEADGPR